MVIVVSGRTFVVPPSVTNEVSVHVVPSSKTGAPDGPGEGLGEGAALFAQPAAVSAAMATMLVSTIKELFVIISNERASALGIASYDR